MNFRKVKSDGTYTTKRFEKCTPATLQQLQRQGWELIEGKKEVDVMEEIQKIKSINKEVAHIPDAEKYEKIELINDNVVGFDETYKVKDLRIIAKEKGIKEYSKLKKTELIEILNK